MVLMLLFACSPEDSGFEANEDTSYPGRPELQAVSASCTEGVIDLRARTLGWSSQAAVDIWSLDAIPEQHESWAPPTVGFRRDEYCDLVEISLNSADRVEPDATLGTSTLQCAQFPNVELTFFFQVWYEEGCAGGQVFGADPEAVYVETQTVVQQPTSPPGNESCLPLNAADPVLRGVVVDEVPPCTEPLE